LDNLLFLDIYGQYWHSSTSATKPLIALLPQMHSGQFVELSCLFPAIGIKFSHIFDRQHNKDKKVPTQTFSCYLWGYQQNLKFFGGPSIQA